MSASLLFSFFIVIAQANDCPTQNKLSPSNLQPEIIKNYIQNNKIKSVEELVCCIAKMPNIEIAIAPNSVAAQNGDIDNPRVLIIQSHDKPKNTEFSEIIPSNINAIFSINSGAPHLLQNDAVEMMFNDRKINEVVYTDIDFNHKNPVSKRNPQACLACHGNSGKMSLGGPRPLFEDAPWSSFVDPGGASRTAFGEPLCPHRKKLEGYIVKHALQAIDSNPRYKCIKNKPKATLGVLDIELEKLNNRRTVKFLKTTPDYSKFKYALMAADRCSYSPEELLPDKVLQKMTDMQFINKELHQLTETNDLLKFIDNELNKNKKMAMLRDANNLQIMNDIRSGKKKNVIETEFDSNFCQLDTTSGLLSKYPEQAELLFRSKNKVYKRYQADSLSTATVGIALRRFLMESRGIDISDWNMMPTPGYERAESIVDEITAQDASKKELQKMINGETPCEELRRASFKAFGEPLPEIDLTTAPQTAQ